MPHGVETRTLMLGILSLCSLLYTPCSMTTGSPIKLRFPAPRFRSRPLPMQPRLPEMDAAPRTLSGYSLLALARTRASTMDERLLPPMKNVSLHLHPLKPTTSQMHVPMFKSYIAHSCNPEYLSTPRSGPVRSTILQTPSHLCTEALSANPPAPGLWLPGPTKAGSQSARGGGTVSAWITPGKCSPCGAHSSQRNRYAGNMCTTQWRCTTPSTFS